MGSDASEDEDSSTHALPIRVHLPMCTQLMGLVDRISNILPKIEAARPRCSSGLQALSHLQIAIERAWEHVQNCCTSKIYLAITGETVKSRFEKTKNVLDQCLSQLQNMVPMALEFEISEILFDLRATQFFIDSQEELAGKALRGILQKDESPVDSVGNSEIELLLFAASMLHIDTRVDLLIEKRYLQRLLDNVNEGKSTKKKTLKCLCYILRKYEKLIMGRQARNSSTQHDKARISVDLDVDSTTRSSGDNFLASQFNYFQGTTPPTEFICSLSSRLMVDPVIISSGQTYERSYIKKWFDEGHDTCPRTSVKLSDLSIRPNTSMRNLILQWFMKPKIEKSDPSTGASLYGSLNNSSNSVLGTTSSMKDLDLRIDASNISIGSVDNSYDNISHVRLEHNLGSIKDLSIGESHIFQFYPSIEDIRKQLLSNIRGLPWELQVAAIQDVNTYLIDYNPSCSLVSSENFLDPLILFLQEAHDNRDRKAQKAGNQLFLTFLQASRSEALVHINENVYTLLASLLAKEAAGEILAIVEALSIRAPSLNFAASSALLSTIFKVLDSQNTEFQSFSLRILFNFSLKLDNSSCKLASEWIPILVPLLENTLISGTCLGILENLYKFEEIRFSPETHEMVAQIIKQLNKFNCEDQEHAVDILLSLCTQHDYYCLLVLRECGIPALVDVSNNGSNKAKALASELLRQLRETKFLEDMQLSPRSNDETSKNCHVEKSDQKSSKTSGFKKWFRKK